MKKVKMYLTPVNLLASELSIKCHGYLMSKLPSDYVDFLHQQETNPFSLNVCRVDEEMILTINLLTEEAVTKFGPILFGLTEIQLDSYDQPIMITKVEMFDLSLQDLASQFYERESQGIWQLTFETPTSFKSQGEYLIFPTLRLIFQSLLQKHSRLVGNGEELDEELLDYLDKHAKITSYRLQTSYFGVHRGKIPAFRGKLTFRLSGASTLKSYVQMLLTFGEYSGLGVKTSLGMGGISFEEK